MKLIRLLNEKYHGVVNQMLVSLRWALYLPFAFIACINFSLRLVLLGSSNALNYIKTVDSIGLVFILRLFGAKIGKNNNIQSGITFHNCKNFKNLIIGNDCHIGKNCFFDLRDSVRLEDNVVISMHCKFVTHIDMTKSALGHDFPSKSQPILIRNDCYLGIGSTVLMGVELGSKVLVGANSLVISSFPDGARIAGVPCKNITIMEAANEY
jgi:acetyltransferase-like isoleucine patch superfamily enzyme